MSIVEDTPARIAEGWDLFGCGDGHAPYEIEKIDCPEDGSPAIFDDDVEAWRHVITMAAHGSEMHVRALAFLALWSMEELVGIANFFLFGEYRTYMKART